MRQRLNQPTTNVGGTNVSNSLIFIGLGLAMALAIGIIALIISIGASQGNLHHRPLVLYNEESQTLLGANQWTNIAYDTNVLFAPTPASFLFMPPDRFRCLRTDNYDLYFSVQTRVNTSGPGLLPLSCGACLLRYAMRATIQHQGVGLMEEILTSHTIASDEVNFLSKRIIFRAESGDILRLQFISPCEHLLLSAITGYNNTNPVSSTVIIQ